MFSGWQKRFFVLRAPGELAYYVTEEDYKRGEGCKGSINVAEIIPSQKGLELSNQTQITIRIGTRVYELQSQSKTEAQSWVESIDAWLLFCTSAD